MNPGLGAWGWLIEQDGKTLVSEFDCTKDQQPMTNNEAEYIALISALQHVKVTVEPSEIDRIVVKGDSQLVIRQMTGEYAVKAPNLHVLYAKVCQMVNDIGIPIEFEWVPREQNEKADALSLLGLRKVEEQVIRDTTSWSWKRHTATPAQRNFLKNLGFDCPVWLGKRAASKKIDELRG